MSKEFKKLPDRYLQSYPNKQLMLPSQIVPLSNQQFTIGRSHQNSLQILHNTISKKHGKISILNGKNYIYDQSSANGIYVNGQKISGQLLIQDGDAIQFGKYPCLYKFFDITTVKNKSKGKGKINLKDYVFQQNPQPDRNRNFNNLEAQQSVLTQPISQGRNDFNLQPSSINKKISKSRESKIKIPDISDYLKLVSNNEQQMQNQTKINNFQAPFEQQKFTRLKKNPKQAKQGRIKLSSLEQQIPSQNQLKDFNLQKRQRNIYFQQQQALQNIQRQKRKIQQQKLKKQLEQAKIAQDLLQKQLLLQQKVREQQQKLQIQKQKLQQQFIKREQIKRQQQLNKIKQIELKEKQMIAKLDQQRTRQLQQLRQKQQIIKQQSENQYKREYQKRKKQLQIEAEALAKQYQNIYRQTIKKVRTQIENQQNTIQKMQKKQQQLQKLSTDLKQNIQYLQSELTKAKNKFIQISGRNKACVLYASDIQDKIDALGTKQFREGQSGYFKTGGVFGQTAKTNVVKKLQQSIINSRKLLKIKEKQYQKIIQQIIITNATIKQKEYASSNDVSEFLETLYQNLKLIETLKQEYLELVQSERAVQQIWQAQLQQNSQLQNKNRVLQGQITKNIRQIDENSRDQIKKSTQQRLHMLKVMHFCPQQKKNAAKFLIQQMLNIQQQIHKFRTNNEQLHKKISKLISQSQKLKRQNQYLSQILFSQDQNGHHFDNMKIVINNLIDKISEQKSIDNTKDCLQLTKQITKIQLMIQNEFQRKKSLRQNMRKIGQLGIAPAQIKINEKNPLVFFGDLLTAKQIQIQKKKSSISSLENEYNNLKSQLKLLDQRKSKASQTLQKYKRQQLSEAKRYLGNNSLK